MEERNPLDPQDPVQGDHIPLKELMPSIILSLFACVILCNLGLTMLGNTNGWIKLASIPVLIASTHFAWKAFLYCLLGSKPKPGSEEHTSH